MLQARRMTVNLTKNELGEIGVVFWVGTKSEVEAQSIAKQICDLMSRAQKKELGFDAGQMMKIPPPGKIIT